jgi:hypothetical protein
LLCKEGKKPGKYVRKSNPDGFCYFRLLSGGMLTGYFYLPLCKFRPIISPGHIPL